MICEIIKDSYKEHLNELNLLDLLTGSDVKMNSKLTLQVAKILENLEKLEKSNMVSKANSYKKIMDDIHKVKWIQIRTPTQITKARPIINVCS